ncbi:MAG: hypothetical protein LBT61_01450 [Prevotellaceae bacterium]|nr:hypothetical protein [Prevotellaceae bacterium]
MHNPGQGAQRRHPGGRHVRGQTRAAHRRGVARNAAIPRGMKYRNARCARSRAHTQVRPYGTWGQCAVCRQGCIPTGCNINGDIPVSTKRHIPTECEGNWPFSVPHFPFPVPHFPFSVFRSPLTIPRRGGGAVENSL